MKPWLVMTFIAVVSTDAFAQAAIAGSVKSPSGAAVSGVTVEASSTALIEKTRVAVTDTSGRYRIEDLWPGMYTVRFSLHGWQPHELRGIELTASFTVRVDATLSLQPVTSEVTVTGTVPAIDMRGMGREISLRGEVVRTLPTARTYNALVVLIPGVITMVNDIVMETATTAFPVHGGRANEGRLMLDGLTVGSPPSGNSAASYAIDAGNAAEITFQGASGLGESETAGLVIRVVPRSGGNTFHGSIFVSGSDDGLQSSNLTGPLRMAGVMASPFTRLYDVSGVAGGPIVKDRLWYFGSVHAGGSTKESTNVFYNVNAGDPSQWLYVPDLARRSYSDRVYENASARATWQVNRRHRVSAFWDAQALCRTCTGATPGLAEPQRVSPEAVGVLGRRLDVAQVTWWSPVTDRLVLEAGAGGTRFGVGNFERTPNPTHDLIRVMEQCSTGCADNGNIPGLVYRSQDYSDAHTGSYVVRASGSYVTGTHSFKVGYQHTLMHDDRTWLTNTQNLTYRFSNGVPNQLTQSISPWVNNTRVAWTALFAQSQWTRGHFTLQAAARFDRARSWFPRQQEGPSRFLPTAIVFPETRGVDSYKDITPRLGLAYDVFGTGRTALKVTIGKYLEGAGVAGNYANTNPSLRMPQTTSVFGTAGVTRAWNDANGNRAADCDLLNPSMQDLRAAGGDLCGAMSNANFGQNVLTNSFDAAILNGWGVRPSDWLLGVSMQQQLGKQSSISFTYTRRSFAGFFVADNRAVHSADMTPFSLVAPQDPRLPGGGGYVVSGLYDVVPEKVGQVDNLVTSAGKYGGWSQYSNNLDVMVNLRVSRELTVVGGTSVGQNVTNNCDVRAHLPELSTAVTGTSMFGPGLAGSAVTPLSPYCDVAYGVLTQFRGLASYIVPKIDLQVSTTIQSKPGPMLAANYAAPNSAVAPSLGRDLSGNAANVTVNLIEPGTMYGRRINEVDLRVAKTFSTGRVRTTLGIDIYNTLNSGTVLTYNNTFVPGGPWLQPLTILTPRFLRLTGEFDF